MTKVDMEAVKNRFYSLGGGEYIPPRAYYSSHTFNRAGISLFYYINGTDSRGLNSSLKLDFFENKLRFTNFKLPHPRGEYFPYFDKFTSLLSCSYDEIEDRRLDVYSEAKILEMASNWDVSRDKFIATLLFAYCLLWDADINDWVGLSMWDGGDFIGPLPSPKKR